MSGASALVPVLKPEQLPTSHAQAALTNEERKNAVAEQGAPFSSFRSISDFAACLMPLLDALGFKGTGRRIAEALPHFADTLDLVGFRNVMANLNYTSRPLDVILNKLDDRLMPCLFVPFDGTGAKILIGYQENGELLWFNGATILEESVQATALSGTAYFFSLVEEADTRSMQRGWVRSIAERFRSLIWQTISMTCMVYIISLCTPLFIMSIYDKVIASAALDTLVYISIGAVIALGADMALRTIRSRVMGYVGARLDNIIGVAIFEHILHLPTALTERATIGAQVARIKDFESVREFFAGPMAMMFIEFPFVLILVLAIAILSGWLFLIPIAMTLIFAALAAFMTPMVRARVAESGQAASKRQEFLVEMVSNMRALKYTAAGTTWLQRYREMSAALAMCNFKTAMISALVNTIGHVIMMLAGVAVMAAGVILVLNQTMTVGALVAVMMLVWRVLAPIQAAFVTLGRLEQMRNSIKQIDNLMRIKAEREPRASVAPLKHIEGKVSFSRVSLRYTADGDPALVGVSFDANPGELVAIIGRNGAGKSTLLKLINGLYVPQAGNIRIDGIDIRQMDPFELRHATAYVPQESKMFFGTISQNLRLAVPTATEDDIIEAAKKANAYADIMALPEGFNTRVGDSRSGAVPVGLQQRIILARAYIRRAPVMMFDEVVDQLDNQGDKAFVEMLKEMRGHTTVFLVTHRPSHMRQADRLIVLESGQMLFNGPPEEGLSKLPKDFL